MSSTDKACAPLLWQAVISRHEIICIFVSFFYLLVSFLMNNLFVLIHAPHISDYFWVLEFHIDVDIRFICDWTEFACLSCSRERELASGEEIRWEVSERDSNGLRRVQLIWVLSITFEPPSRLLSRTRQNIEFLPEWGSGCHPPSELALFSLAENVPTSHGSPQGILSSFLPHINACRRIILS